MELIERIIVASIIVIIASYILIYTNHIGGVIALGVAYPAVVTIFLLIYINGEPKAIDVYRNKTSLEITYKEGIPIDTTVVFK